MKVKHIKYFNRTLQADLIKSMVHTELHPACPFGGGLVAASTGQPGAVNTFRYTPTLENSLS